MNTAVENNAPNPQGGSETPPAEGSLLGSGAATVEGGAADTITGAEGSLLGADTVPAEGATVEGGADTAEDGADTAEGGEDTVSGAPEAYDFAAYTEKLEEGETLNPAMMDEVSSLSKEFNLSQAAAEKLVDIGRKQRDGFMEAQNTEYANTRKEWREEVAKDPVIGGATPEAQAKNMSIALRGLTAYEGGAEARQLLDETGLGDNPQMLRFLHSVGLSVSQDSVEEGAAAGANAVKARSTSLFPSMKDK